MDSMDSRVPRLALVPPQALPTGPTGPTGPLRGDQQSELPRSFASVNMFFNFCICISVVELPVVEQVEACLQET